MVLEAASTADDVLKFHFPAAQSVCMPEGLEATIDFVIPDFCLESGNEVSKEGSRKEKEAGASSAAKQQIKRDELKRHILNHQVVEIIDKVYIKTTSCPE
jgi:3-oxoacyl-[acyl-carrier-protein] synthase III